MVFCLIHKRKHKGQAAKMACIVSQDIDISWEDALGRIKEMNNKSHEKNHHVRETWAMSEREVNDTFWLMNETKRFADKHLLLRGDPK